MAKFALLQRQFCQKCIKVSVICKTTLELIKKEGEKKSNTPLN